MSTDIEAIVRQAVEQTLHREPVKATPPKKKLDGMTLSAAKFLAERVEEEARRMGVNAVVAISDGGGNLTLCECMDNSYFASRAIAMDKAYTVVALKMSTMTLKPLAQPGASLYGIQFTNGGKIVIFGGGDPLHNGAGEIVGGLGVSGGSEEEDAALSAYGRRFFENEMK